MPWFFAQFITSTTTGGHMCGIAGCYNTPNAPEITKLGLHLLQHRGQEWVGIISSDGHSFYPERAPFRGEGLVLPTLTTAVMRSMMGYMAMGHVRYSTQGASELTNAQPHRARSADGTLFFASNGDVVNCTSLRRELTRNGTMFYSVNDGELIIKLIAEKYKVTNDLVEAIRAAKRQLNGSFSGVLMTVDRMFLIRDSMENRPFCYTIAPDGAVFFASESSALDIMTADHKTFKDIDYELREVPGDAIIELAQGKVIIHPDPMPHRRIAHCIFEMIYFARPDSRVFGVSAKEFRHKLGRKLVEEAKPSGTIVAPVPDSSVEAALAVAQATGIPFGFVIYRHHYTGRTFIAPTQLIRDYGVKIKFNPDRSSIHGQEIVLVDDSIVRGSTMRKIIRMIKRCKPKCITLLITCPLIMKFCYYGIDMKDRLIAAITHGDIEKIKEEIGLEKHDSLHFMSLSGLKSCCDNPSEWCFGCLSGDYPTDISVYEPPEL